MPKLQEIHESSNMPFVNDKFKEVVNKLTDRKCEFIILKEPPVMGAIIWAYELANQKLPDESTKNKIRDSINNYQENL